MKGIYKIENRINGKMYIGESLDIEKRWKEHIKELNENTHHSNKLQEDWNKYGEDNFEFTVLEELDPEIPNFCKKYVNVIYENMYIKQYDSINKGYNTEDTLSLVLEGKRTIFTNKKRDRGVMKSILNNKIDNDGRYKIYEIICNETGEKFKSATDCCEHYNINSRNLKQHLNGKLDIIKKCDYTFSCI